jgi:hypothetical protein
MAFRVLATVVGAAFVLFGLTLFASFFAYQRPNSVPGLPGGPVVQYFAAFAGCALIGWGGALFAVRRDPAGGRAVAIATAWALVAMALYRMVAWIVGDYYTWLGELPRIEAAVFLLLALAFVWLRPPAPARSA